MRKLLAILFLLALSAPATAQQQVLCPTRPGGDSSNACASTAFVANATSAIATTALPAITTSQIYGGTGTAGVAHAFPLGTGVPAALQLTTNASGGLLSYGSAPIAGLTGFGTGVATALGNATNSAGGVPTQPVANSSLANTTITVNGTVCTLGSSCSPATSGTANASGSTQSTTGTIAASSTSLTLAAAKDFVNGQGIIINHAGATFSASPPTAGVVTPVGTAGSTAYAYYISSVDANGGIGIAQGPVPTSTGNATLSCYGSTNNYNNLTWTAGSGAVGYAIYGDKAGSIALLGFSVGTSFQDCGTGALTTAPFWAPTTQPGTALNDWLLTTISSGGGTTSLTLATSSGTAGSCAGGGCTVNHDDTAAINAAITALPTNGGVVNLAASTYNVSAPITLGNGSAGVFSTTRGMFLQGTGAATGPYAWAYPALSGTTLNWQGSLNQPVIKLAGPLQGWGINDIAVNCNSVAGFGLYIQSAQFGRSSDIYTEYCVYGLYTTALTPFASSDVDSFHNDYRNLTILQPHNSTSWGIFIYGTTTSNTDFNTISNLTISGGGGNLQYGIYYGPSDSNYFTDVHMGNGTTVPLTFDYTVTNSQPAANVIMGIDPGSNYAGSQNVGSPSASTNYIYATMGSNGGACPTLSALTCK